MPIRVYYEVLNQKGTPALYSDNYAQRPAAGYQGRIFYSPDTAQIFYDTGSTWTLLADAGVGSGSLASVCANGNTTATGIVITAGGLSANSVTATGLPQGSVVFAAAGGTLAQSNTNFFYDIANSRLGLGTNAPGTTLDIHGTGGTLVHLNGTGANNSYLLFQNAGVGKWRIGNTYGGATNSFGIYNNTLAANALTIDSTSNATFVANVSAGSFSTGNGLNFIVTGGQTTITGTPTGINIQLPTTFTQQFIFPTAASYNYTYPSNTSTLLGTGVGQTTNNIPKYTANTGLLTASMLSDDGTSVTSAGATRSNLYIKALNNTYYGQLAFTNGTNGAYGGLSYNTANQWMQFEANSSEYMRLYGNGNLRLFTSSASDAGVKFQVEGNTIMYGTAGNILNLQKTSGAASLLMGSNLTDYALIESISGGGFIFYAGNGTLTEKMRIRSDGNVGIGNPGNAALRLAVSGTTSNSSATAFYVENTISTLFQVRNDGLILTGVQANSPYNLPIATGRTAYLFSDGSLGYQSSVRESKTNINEINDTSWLFNLNPVSFNKRFRDDDGNYTNQYCEILDYGLIAEEVELVNSNICFYDENENGKILRGVSYEKLITPMLKAIQELNNKIENLN